jgi:hypothetical protein
LQAQQQDIHRRPGECERDMEVDITKLKIDAATLAYLAENAVDMANGAIEAVATHGNNRLRLSISLSLLI